MKIVNTSSIDILIENETKINEDDSRGDKEQDIE
jgi:hypothetical protein